MMTLGKWHGWFWQVVQLSMYVFAFANLRDVFRQTGRSVFDQWELSVEAVTAPMFALIVAFLGLASTAVSEGELRARVHGCILWCIAIASAYLWFASLVISDESIGHLLILAALLYGYIPSAVAGFILAVAVNLLSDLLTED